MTNNLIGFEKAAKFIAFFEGYVSVARWDVNAYRLGFGSDTEGPDQVKVIKGMTTTLERALDNLTVRLPQFCNVIINQVGLETWTALASSSQVALLDFAYNYGDLTPSLADAVKDSQPIAKIVAFVQAREGDNDGINRIRRAAEAALIASEL